MTALRLLLLASLWACPSALAQQAPGGATAPAAPGWVARSITDIQALDKVYARSTTLSLRVGEAAKFGTLTIVAGACQVRPPDQAADATAFLTITDGTSGTPVFRGWMFATNPALAMLEHPIYDIRVTGCR